MRQVKLKIAEVGSHSQKILNLSVSFGYNYLSQISFRNKKELCFIVLSMSLYLNLVNVLPVKSTIFDGLDFFRFPASIIKTSLFLNWFIISLIFDIGD